MPDEIRSWDAAAEAYDAWVISPFAPDVDFPVRNHVRRLLDTWKQRGELRRRVAFDCGCGKGQALTLIAGQVGFACGLDFSPRMLDLSERLLKTRGIAPSRYPHRGGLTRLRVDLHEFNTRKADGTRTVLVEADMRNLAPLKRSADLLPMANVNR